MTMATATEVQNNFGRFLKVAQEGGEVVILKNGVEVARLVSKEKTMSFLSDQLVGVLSNDVDEKAARAERMKRHEGSRWHQCDPGCPLQPQGVCRGLPAGIPMLRSSAHHRVHFHPVHPQHRLYHAKRT